MCRELNPVIQRNILDKEYVSIRDLMKLYGWSKSTATIEFKNIQHQIESEDKPMMRQGRTFLIPVDLILKKYPMNYQRISRAAKRFLEENSNKWQKRDI